MQEFALIDRLRTRLRSKRLDTRLGIGDDAALIAPPAGQELAVTTDTLIAGRHFPVDTAAFDIGYKAAAVNLSDLAAMGAQPAWLTLALAAPELSQDWCDAFIDGVEAGIGPASVDIIGGDTTRGPLTITVTAIGHVPAGRAIRRDGARAGQLVVVTGTLGDAAYGLSVWPDRMEAPDADRDLLLARLCRPQWRPGVGLIGYASAAIDVSDGLAADLGHVLAASGIGATINVDALPTSDALAQLLPDRAARQRLQLSGGDDYELCLTLDEHDLPGARRAMDCPLTVIGRTNTSGALRLVDDDANSVDRLGDTHAGWDHFA